MQQCIDTASDCDFPCKHAVCCIAIGIRLCNGTLECRGICTPSTGGTLCSGDCAHCSGTRELPKQCVRGFPAGIMFYCCSVGFVSHRSCQRYVGGEIRFSARGERDQLWLRATAKTISKPGSRRQRQGLPSSRNSAVRLGAFTHVVAKGAIYFILISTSYLVEC